MGALDAAYHALTRVRPAFRVPAMPETGSEIWPVLSRCGADARRGCAEQRDERGVRHHRRAVRRAGASLRHTGRCSCQSLCVPASRRAAAPRVALRLLAHAACAFRSWCPAPLTRPGRATTAGCVLATQRHAPRPRTHHGPHTPLRLACACRRVAHASPPVPGRSSRAGGPARNGCALQRLSFRVAPQNTLSPAPL